jgi:hypothetical protein
MAHLLYGSARYDAAAPTATEAANRTSPPANISTEADPSPGTELLLFRAGEQAQAGYAAKDAIVRGNRQAETESCRGDPPVAVVDFVSERVSDLGGR